MRSRRSPVHFVVARHLASHPDDGPAAIARHCNLNVSPASRALHRLLPDGLSDAALLRAMQQSQEKPSWRTFHFRVPNPDQFLTLLKVPYWISGEYAAAAEGYDLVPERLKLYVQADGADQALQAAMAAFGKVAPPTKANVTIALTDPWMHLDPDSEFIERGQRLLDYQSSRHLQILKELHG